LIHTSRLETFDLASFSFKRGGIRRRTIDFSGRGKVTRPLRSGYYPT